MLGKLMKYEWKNIWKAGTLMLLGMLVVTVIGCVVLRMPGGVVTGLLDNNDINATQSWFVLSSFVATLILYVIMLLASTWGMLIFLGIRFYRSMYTDEGYLSHTLPVTANQLFLSKILVSGVWYLFISIGIGISVVALVVSLMTGLLNIGELSSVLTQYNGNIWEFLADAFYELGRTYEEEMGINLLHYGITLLLTYVAGPFITMVTLFGASDDRSAIFQTQRVHGNPGLCRSDDSVFHHRQHRTECLHVWHKCHEQLRRIFGNDQYGL